MSTECSVTDVAGSRSPQPSFVSDQTILKHKQGRRLAVTAQPVQSNKSSGLREHYYFQEPEVLHSLGPPGQGSSYPYQPLKTAPWHNNVGP